jgi:cytochrome c-type biogenesis protein CcmF
MLADLGQIALLLALAVAVYSVFAAVIGARQRMPELVVSAENGALAVFGLTLIAVLILIYSFVTHDFRIEYVAENSNRAMPAYLLPTSLWGGQAGSLLFWSALLSVYVAGVVITNRGRHRELMPWVIAVLESVQVFFLVLVTIPTNPFAKLNFVPADGNGLNPLLRHPAMLLHPPTLYLGFTGMTVPFAFAMAALITRRLDSEWIRLTRRWTLIAWLFLSIGIMLGGRWAYDVLGWGGYWGWDPVENASFLPWLTGTALLHSVMVQERKGMLKVWNMVLVITTFSLVMFGTFITRSGVIQSVHAFAQSPIGAYFLVFIAAMILGSVGLLFDRLPNLKSKAEMTSLISREAIFLLQNLLFVSATFAIFWGTIFPMISEIITGNKITVGPPYFNTVAGPIFGAIVLVMGVIPLISWGGTTLRRLEINLIQPVVAAGVGVGVLVVLGVRQPVGLAGFGLVIFSGYTTLMEFIRGTRLRHRSTGENYLQAPVGLIRRNRRRYGGYLVHAAMVLIALGIVGSSVYKVEETAVLKRGEAMTVGAYTLTYQGLDQFTQADKQVTRARLVVTENGRSLGIFTPVRDFYPAQQQPMTIPYVRTTPKEDLYVILNAWDDGGATATFKATLNPLVVWLWIGGLLFIFSTLVALWPESERSTVPVREVVAQPGPRPAHT